MSLWNGHLFWDGKFKYNGEACGDNKNSEKAVQNMPFQMVNLVQNPSLYYHFDLG